MIPLLVRLRSAGDSSIQLVAPFAMPRSQSCDPYLDDSAPFQWREPFGFRWLDAGWRLWAVDGVIVFAIAVMIAIIFPMIERGPTPILWRWGWSLAFGVFWILWFEVGCLLRKVRIGERGISRHAFSMGMGLELGSLRVPIGPMGYYGLIGSSVVNWREVTRVTIERAHCGNNSLWFPVLTVDRKYQRSWRCGLPQSVPLLPLADWLRQRGTEVLVVEDAEDPGSSSLIEK